MDLKSVLEADVATGIPAFIPRDYRLQETTARKITTLTGPRRSGKTYVLYQAAKERGSWYFVNFEDERLDLKPQLLGEICGYVSGKAKNLFLDEVDKLPNWETSLRRVMDSYREINFFASASSARLSYPLLPSSLRGRTLSYEILPLSFREFLGFKGFDERIGDERAASQLKELVEEFVLFGAFPEVVVEKNQKLKVDLLSSYFETTVAVDISERHSIDPNLVKFAARMLRKGNYYSASKTYEIFKSAGFRVGKELVLRLENVFSEAYYAAFVEIFSLKAKDIMLYPRKPYLLDCGLIAFGIRENFGRLYENAVYVELRRRKGFEEEINYWKSSEGYEVDFVLRQGSEVKSLIQVCYEFENEGTAKREVRSLVRAASEFKVKKGMVITRDLEKEEEIDGLLIRFVPLWKFLTTTGVAAKPEG